LIKDKKKINFSLIFTIHKNFIHKITINKKNKKCKHLIISQSLKLLPEYSIINTKSLIP
jgi:hypothetical protein